MTMMLGRNATVTFESPGIVGVGKGLPAALPRCARPRIRPFESDSVLNAPGRSMAFPPRTQDTGIALEDSLRGVLALGVLAVDGVTHEPGGRAWIEERDGVVGRTIGQHSGRAAADVPGVAEVRTLFHRVGVDPTKTRPSSEALLRRVLQGKGLPEVDPVVDVCNLCSLEHQLPLGLYDRDRIEGAVTVRIGHDGEGYDGIRKARISVAGRLAVVDAAGPFGAPTSDSLRTCVTPATSRVLVVVFCPPERAAASLAPMLESVAGRLGRFCGGLASALQVVQ